MKYIFYDIIFISLFLLYFPILFFRGKCHRGMFQRFGLWSQELKDRFSNKESIWVHAVSVGEVNAVSGLIQRIKALYPDKQIVLTTVTERGYEIAQKSFDQSIIVLFAPFDISFIIKHYILILSPVIYISTETEIWPNIYAHLKSVQVPIIIINGRISDKAFKGYQRFQFIIKKALSCVTCFCMQSKEDARRIELLGGALDSIKVMGNLKFDNIPDSKDYKWPSNMQHSQFEFIIAGSTHPGEEKMLLDVFKKLSNHDPQLRLVIAPRDVKRAKEVMTICSKEGEEGVFYSDIKQGVDINDHVIVVDTIGDLGGLYSLANMVFVGKSLSVGGGQNILEPVFFGKPTFVGPMTQNFKDVVRILKQESVLVQVEDHDELYVKMKELLGDKQRMDEIKNKSSQVIKDNQGVMDMTLTEIKTLIENRVH